MMDYESISAWSADDKPTRWDIVAAVSSLLLAVVYLSTIETVSWIWLAVGFVASALAMGPVAASTTGKRIGAWFEAIGVVGRVIAIIAFAVVYSMVAAALDIPDIPMMSFIIGGLSALGIIVVIEAVRVRVLG